MTATVQNKILVVMIMTSMLYNADLSAQTRTNPKLLADANLSIEWMRSNLDLRNDQIKAVSDLNLKYAMKFDSISSSTADRFTKFQKAYRIKKQRDNELKFILTPEQYIAYLNKDDGRDDAFARSVKEMRPAENDDLSISN